MKRVFSLALGLGAGLLIGAYVVRRLDEAQRAVAPTTLAGQAGRTAARLVDQLRAVADEARSAAADREAELRGRYEVPSLTQVLGG